MLEFSFIHFILDFVIVDTIITGYEMFTSFIHCWCCSVTQYYPTPNDSMDCSMPKYWSFSFSISPSNEYSGLISFRITWFDLLAVQGILKCLFQLHSSKASILQCSAFFMVKLSHSYMTTGKAIAMTKKTLVGKVMTLLFNIQSRIVIAFLPGNKHINFMAADTIYSDFGAQENKICY